MRETRPIPGYPGYAITRDGELWSMREAEPKLIKARPKEGYLHVNIKIGSGRSTQRKRPIHQLVLLAWVGPRPSPKHVSRHKDTVRTNNDADNLLWGTVKENVHDAIALGIHSSVTKPRLKVRPA